MHEDCHRTADHLSGDPHGGRVFCTGNMTRLMETVPREVIGLTRNVCHAFGYESVALIPIRLGDEVLGLVHLADPRVHAILPEIVESIERAALLVGTAIQRGAEEALRRSPTNWTRRCVLERPNSRPPIVCWKTRHASAIGWNGKYCTPLREQQRIGQELHDGLGQELTGLSYVARSVYQRLVEQGSADANLVAELDGGMHGPSGRSERSRRACFRWELVPKASFRRWNRWRVRWRSGRAYPVDSSVPATSLWRTTRRRFSFTALLRKPSRTP